MDVSGSAAEAEIEAVLRQLRSTVPGFMPREQQEQLEQQLQGMSESEVFAAGCTAALRACLNPANYPEGVDRETMLRIIMTTLLVSILSSEHQENNGTSDGSEEEESD